MQYGFPSSIKLRHSEKATKFKNLNFIDKGGLISENVLLTFATISKKGCQIAALSSFTLVGYLGWGQKFGTFFSVEKCLNAKPYYIYVNVVIEANFVTNACASVNHNDLTVCNGF